MPACLCAYEFRDACMLCEVPALCGLMCCYVYDCLCSCGVVFVCEIILYAWLYVCVCLILCGCDVSLDMHSTCLMCVCLCVRVWSSKMPNWFCLSGSVYHAKCLIVCVFIHAFLIKVPACLPCQALWHLYRHHKHLAIHGKACVRGCVSCPLPFTIHGKGHTVCVCVCVCVCVTSVI